PVVSAGGLVTTYLPPGRWLDWWSQTVHQGPTTLRRRVPLRELPLYLRENSLFVLGPVRNYVAEAPADPLTVEVFVTTEATFGLRPDAGSGDFQGRRHQGRVPLEASRVAATLIVRLHDVDPPTAATADGQPLPSLELGRLDETERGWAVDGRTTVL